MKNKQAFKQHLSLDNLPDDMLELAGDLRQKAVDAANSLMDQGYKVPVAVSMATERARNWGGLPDGTLGHHVIPYNDGWGVMKADADQPSVVLPTKQEAVTRGREIARNQHGKLVIHGQDGMVQESYSYTDE